VFITSIKIAILGAFVAVGLLVSGFFLYILFSIMRAVQRRIQGCLSVIVAILTFVVLSPLLLLLGIRFQALIIPFGILCVLAFFYDLFSIAKLALKWRKAAKVAKGSKASKGSSGA
jgi:hypothetical protein